MIPKELETPVLTTGGAITAIYQFMQGDLFNLILGTVLTATIIVLNVFKIRKYYREEKERRNENN